VCSQGLRRLVVRGRCNEPIRLTGFGGPLPLNNVTGVLLTCQVDMEVRFA